MLPKAHLTLHSRMSSSRWVIIPLWLSGSWRSFLYSSVYYCHLLLISSASVTSIVKGSRSVVSDSLRPHGHQAPPSMGFSRQEYWSGLTFPSPGNFPTQGSNPGFPHCRQIPYQLNHSELQWNKDYNSVSGSHDPVLISQTWLAATVLDHTKFMVITTESSIGQWGPRSCHWQTLLPPCDQLQHPSRNSQLLLSQILISI